MYIVGTFVLNNFLAMNGVERIVNEDNNEVVVIPSKKHLVANVPVPPTPSGTPAKSAMIILGPNKVEKKEKKKEEKKEGDHIDELIKIAKETYPITSLTRKNGKVYATFSKEVGQNTISITTSILDGEYPGVDLDAILKFDDRSFRKVLELIDVIGKYTTAAEVKTPPKINNAWCGVTKQATPVQVVKPVNPHRNIVNEWETRLEENDLNTYKAFVFCMYSITISSTNDDGFVFYDMFANKSGRVERLRRVVDLLEMESLNFSDASNVCKMFESFEKELADTYYKNGMNGKFHMKGHIAKTCCGEWDNNHRSIRKFMESIYNIQNEE